MGKTEYPALSAAPRSGDDGNRTAWGRYDVPGQTFYVAETRACAYAEVLSAFKRTLGSADPLERDAAALGMTVEEFIEEVARDWSDRDFMGLGAVPAGWRYDRGMYSIVMRTDRPLVDIEHPDSIAAIEKLMGYELSLLGIKGLTTAHLRGDGRAVTTAIAARLQAETLDTDEHPVGIHFGSKHGGSWCRAFWLDGLEKGDLTPLSPESILVTDDDLKTTSDRFRIRVF